VTEHETLAEVQAELAAAGLPTEEVGAIRIVQSGKFAGIPYMLAPVGGETEAWSRLRGMCFGRRYPVVVGEVEGVYDRLGDKAPAASDVIAEGRRLDTTNHWRELLIASANRWRISGDDKVQSIASMMEMPGLWPIRGVGLDHRLHGRRRFATGRTTTNLLLPLCPDPWMAPAYLRAEGHNYRLDAAVQCAVFRSWYLRFGAEVNYMNGSTYEFAVGQPPTDRDAALELACEHYLFCPDRRDELSGSGLRAFAAELMQSSWWYFWWD